MPTLSAGVSTEVYVPVSGSMTVTPGAGGRVRVDVSVRQGMAPVDVVSPIHSARTFSVPGGATVFLEAIGAAASYSSVPGDGKDPRDLYSAGGVRAHIYGNSHFETGYNWARLQGASEGRFVIVQNSAVSGFRTDQVLAKLQAEGLAASANVMPFGEGTNDAIAGVTTAAHIANMRAIALHAAGMGVTPLLCVCPPTDKTYQATTHAYYHAEIELAKELGIPWIDPWATVTDTDGTFTSGTADATQEHVAAGPQWALGSYLQEWFSGSKISMLLPRSNSAPGLVNTTQNQLALTDTNADGLPDGWSLLTMTGHTVNATTDLTLPMRGKLASVSVSQSSVGYMHRPGYTTGWAAGETVRVSGLMEIASAVNLKTEIIVRCQGSGTTLPVARTYFGDVPLHYFEGEVVIAGTGLTDLQLQIKVSNVVGSISAFSGTVKWGALHLYNVTRNRFA